MAGSAIPEGRSDLAGGEFEAALTAALGALSRRERTVAELRTWLGDRGFDPETVEEALAELIGIGELDDERFAIAFAADKRELSGWGPDRIAEALLHRGLGRDLVERACAENRGSQLARAVAQLADRGDDLRVERGRARALAYLARRGYDLELAYDAIRRAAGEMRPTA